jgi:hypothetical protein
VSRLLCSSSNRRAQPVAIALKPVVDLEPSGCSCTALILHVPLLDDEVGGFVGFPRPRDLAAALFCVAADRCVRHPSSALQLRAAARLRPARAIDSVARAAIDRPAAPCCAEVIPALLPLGRIRRTDGPGHRVDICEAEQPVWS